MIRFRAWDPVKNEMHYWDSSQKWSVMDSWTDFLIMHWSGIYDVKENPVYEGDYVSSYSKTSGRIECQGFVRRTCSTEWFWCKFGTIHVALDNYNYNIEIKGNIYQNSELKES